MAFRLLRRRQAFVSRIAKIHVNEGTTPDACLAISVAGYDNVRVSKLHIELELVSRLTTP